MLKNAHGSKTQAARGVQSITQCQDQATMLRTRIDEAKSTPALDAALERSRHAQRAMYTGAKRHNAGAGAPSTTLAEEIPTSPRNERLVDAGPESGDEQRSV